jgi:hypothetical protein
MPQYGVAVLVKGGAINGGHGKAPGSPLNQGIDEDQAKIWEYGKGKGIIQTMKNGILIVKDTSFKALFPIQKGVSEWMGDVRVRRR